MCGDLKWVPFEKSGDSGNIIIKNIYNAFVFI